MTPDQLTRMHRRQQLALRAATKREFLTLWPALEWERLDATYPDFAARVALLVATNRRTGMGLAAAYLRAFRVASGLPGDVQIVLPAALPIEQVRESLRVTSVVSAKAAAKNGATASTAMTNALSSSSGAVARLVLNAGREAITATTEADPRAAGWRRVLGGAGCDFCRMLAGRGGVYGEQTGDFEAHDHCGCSTAPVYLD